MSKQIYFKQFSLANKTSSFSNKSVKQISTIWLIDRTLIGATIPGQRGLGSDGSESVLLIPQNFSITRISPSDCFVLYPGHLFEESYPWAEMNLVYSTAPAVSASYTKGTRPQDIKKRQKYTYKEIQLKKPLE